LRVTFSCDAYVTVVGCLFIYLFANEFKNIQSKFHTATGRTDRRTYVCHLGALFTVCVASNMRDECSITVESRGRVDHRKCGQHSSTVDKLYCTFADYL